ncbi:MAG: excisionase family DNA binding protein [Crocinitomix sp.]|jgi:excisionase family DNA binding protein
MKDILFTPLRLSELELLIQNSVANALKNQIQPDQTIEADKFLDINEAATFLHLKESTVRTKVSKGELPFMKPDGTKGLIFSRLELTEFIKSGKKKSNAEIEAEADAYINKKKGAK